MVVMYEVAKELLLQLDKQFLDGGTACLEFGTAHFLNPRFKGIGLEPFGRYDDTKASVVEAMLLLVGVMLSLNGHQHLLQATVS